MSGYTNGSLGLLGALAGSGNAQFGLLSKDLSNSTLAGLGGYLTSFSLQQKNKEEWETKIIRWSTLPSDSEQERIARTIRMVEDALKEDPVLSKLVTKTFLQGSYRNKTNIRIESDVDVCILLQETVYYHSAATTPFTTHQNYIPSQPPKITAQQFKPLLKAALDRKFGASMVKNGNKALEVRASTARVHADIVPAIPYQYYYSQSGTYLGTSSPYVLNGGVALFPNTGGVIVNWPNEHFVRGEEKDTATSGIYKTIVRFFKRLNLEIKSGIYKPLPPFLIESLVYNVPNLQFCNATLYDDAIAVLNSIEQECRFSSTASVWKEANGIKSLWYEGQKWTKTEAHNFAQTAIKYISR